jgi:hypothetical protein
MELLLFREDVASLRRSEIWTKNKKFEDSFEDAFVQREKSTNCNEEVGCENMLLDPPLRFWTSRHQRF